MPTYEFVSPYIAFEQYEVDAEDLDTALELLNNNPTDYLCDEQDDDITYSIKEFFKTIEKAIPEYDEYMLTTKSL